MSRDKRPGSDMDQLNELAKWRAKEAKHQPSWPDLDKLKDDTDYLRTLPPLVFAGEADKLRREIALASRGESFVLMGGDCAETFAESTADHIREKIRTILQMAVVLTYGASVPVVKIGRMAGQFAKPRSKPTEVRDGVELPSYLGDIVNGFDFTPEARTPDSSRLIQAYQHSAATLNLIRAFTTGGFADLSKVHEWNKGFMQNPAYAKYENLATEIDRAMRFLHAARVSDESLRTVDMYVAHEALLLDYEEALTRIDSRTGNLYNCSAHMLWIGERTRGIDDAHVDMLSRVHNPIGVKLGPTTQSSDVLALIDALNPEGEEGRLTFITRMGAGVIRDRLPSLVEAVKGDGRPVTWVSDPMHGNTITTDEGFKTRRLKDIFDEINGFFAVHSQMGTHPGGIHLELTGDDVTEVLGGSEEVLEETLGERYETLVDPRLNHQQSLEIAFLVAEALQETAL
ncbi:MAG: 3-deoxy-7-phosphoheptulonate synthase class II [Actinomycetaceae bacterium]|nr:3-deoxy-7-phosphoheptulonate synthase class II [Actinomycetaceae bacterium]